MASADTHGILDKWASAWSSHDVEVILRLFTDDCVYEDVLGRRRSHSCPITQPRHTGVARANLILALECVRYVPAVGARCSS